MYREICLISSVFSRYTYTHITLISTYDHYMHICIACWKREHADIRSKVAYMHISKNFHLLRRLPHRAQVMAGHGMRCAFVCILMAVFHAIALRVNDWFCCTIIFSCVLTSCPSLYSQYLLSFDWSGNSRPIINLLLIEVAGSDSWSLNKSYIKG